MKHLFGIFILIFSFQSIGSAQHVSLRNNFKANVIKGCGPLAVTFSRNIPSDQGEYGVAFLEDEECFEDYTCIDWSQSNPNISVLSNLNPTFSHTYTQTGVYTVAFIPIGSGGIDESQMDYFRIEVLDPVSTVPKFSYSVCSGRKVKLNFEPNQIFSKYRISSSEGSSVLDITQGLQKTISFTQVRQETINVVGLLSDDSESCNSKSISLNIQNELESPVIESIFPKDDIFEITFSQIDNNSFVLEQKKPNQSDFIKHSNFNSKNIAVPNEANTCYRIAYDLCSSEKKYSNTLCTVGLEGASEEEANVLRPSYSAGNFSTVNLYKNQKQVEVTVFPYSDEELICGQEDLYFLEAESEDGKLSRSSALSLKAKKSKSLVPLTSGFVSYEAKDKVALFWLSPKEEQVASYSLLTNQQKKVTKDTFYTMEVEPISQRYCYRLSYSNACDQSSDEVEFCSIYLSKKEESTQATQLSWDYDISKLPGLSFELEKLALDYELLETIDLANRQSYVENIEQAPKAKLIYRIKATSLDNPSISFYSNPVEVEFKPIWKFPNAFSPNKDGNNDVFTFVGNKNLIREFELNVFSRWGNLIFTNNANSELIGWDGQKNGVPVPEGIYTYKATMTDSFGDTHQSQGSIFLIR